MRIEVNGKEIRFALHLGLIRPTRKERKYTLKFEINTERQLSSYEQEKIGDIIFEAIRQQLYEKPREESKCKTCGYVEGHSEYCNYLKINGK